MQKALKLFDYPGGPEDLARHAESNGAGQALVEALRELDKKEGFSGPNAVIQGCRAQPTPLAALPPAGVPNARTRTRQGPSWQVTEVQKALLKGRITRSVVGRLPRCPIQARR